jgi:hypothetical protein
MQSKLYLQLLIHGRKTSAKEVVFLKPRKDTRSNAPGYSRSNNKNFLSEAQILQAKRVVLVERKAKILLPNLDFN